MRAGCRVTEDGLNSRFWEARREQLCTDRREMRVKWALLHSETWGITGAHFIRNEHK